MPENLYNKKIIKIEVKPNYIVCDFEDPPNVIKYVRKEIISKQGNRDLLTLAVIKDPDTNTTKTVATSLWRPIKSKSGRKILRYYLKYHPKKVHFANEELKKQFLHETTVVFNQSILKFLEATK
jgi:hypothetical protein